METSDDYIEHDECISRVVFENELRGFQIRLTVSEFRGKYYIGLRKWYADMYDDWFPTKQGFSWEYNLESTSALFEGLTSILSESEVLHDVIDKLGYDMKVFADLNDCDHPRFKAGYEQALEDLKNQNPSFQEAKD